MKNNCFLFFCEGYFCLSFFIVLNTSYFPILYHFTSLALFLYDKFVILYSANVCFQSYFSTKLFFLIFIELISFFFILLIFFPPFLFFFPLFFFLYRREYLCLKIFQKFHNLSAK